MLKAREVFQKVTANVLGAVLNQVLATEQDHSYYYYYNDEN